MPLIVRIDVDRPYGKYPFVRHALSRLSSDCYFPAIGWFGYLRELEWMLQLLNERHAHAYIFFRACTLPSGRVMKLVKQGAHTIGLHLENSRSFSDFKEEKDRLERHVGATVTAFSKHGSGGARYGRRHYAPYEPEKYVQWAQAAGMKLFFGNLEDPSLPSVDTSSFRWFPSAFWLEPHWRDTKRFSVEWLLSAAKDSEKVLLVHPENVRENSALTDDFVRLISSREAKMI